MGYYKIHYQFSALAATQQQIKSSNHGNVLYIHTTNTTHPASTQLFCLIFPISKRRERRPTIRATLTINSMEEELRGLAALTAGKLRVCRAWTGLSGAVAALWYRRYVCTKNSRLKQFLWCTSLLRKGHDVNLVSLYYLSGNPKPFFIFRQENPERINESWSWELLLRNLLQQTNILNWYQHSSTVCKATALTHVSVLLSLTMC